ncbi:hypothetical protein HZA97_06785 [Candidatus Woesearchaeota archaeon]|nr:hypothetical protein [Candidatus Woesearchaeota archaeon]
MTEFSLDLDGVVKINLTYNRQGVLDEILDSNGYDVRGFGMQVELEGRMFSFGADEVIVTRDGKAVKYRKTKDVISNPNSPLRIFRNLEYQRK